MSDHLYKNEALSHFGTHRSASEDPIQCCGTLYLTPHTIDVLHALLPSGTRLLSPKLEPAAWTNSAWRPLITHSDIPGTRKRSLTIDGARPLNSQYKAAMEMYYPDSLKYTATEALPLSNLLIRPIQPQR